MAEYIEREEAIATAFTANAVGNSAYRDIYDTVNRLRLIPAADVVPVPEGGIDEMSDGYHTFNSLYNQRLHLFAALCNAYPDRAWKSKLHEDGTKPFGGGWFIVGIDTPEGSYTYHYELKDWDLFKCTEIERGKPWDGHTDKDVARVLSLPAADVVPVRHGQWNGHDIGNGRISIDEDTCSLCGSRFYQIAETGCKWSFCPNCGATMDLVTDCNQVKDGDA